MRPGRKRPGRVRGAARGNPYMAYGKPQDCSDNNAAGQCARLLHRLLPSRFRPLPADSFLVADKAYDADWIRDLIEQRDAVPIIPDREGAKTRYVFSKPLYRLRNRIERAFNKLKQFRRIATRYEKLVANFLAMIKLATVRIWLRAYESAA